MVLFISYASLAWASVVQEDAIVVGSPQDSYVQAYYIPDPPKYTPGLFKPVGNGYCVALLQAHGFEEYSGDAYTWKRYMTDAKIGWEGDAILLDEGPTEWNGIRYQHLVKILWVDYEGYHIVEQNGAGGRYVIEYRTIKFDYDKIVGFIPLPVKNNNI